MNQPRDCDLADSINRVLDSDESQLDVLCSQLEQVLAPYDQIVMCSSVETKTSNEQISKAGRHIANGNASL